MHHKAMRFALAAIALAALSGSSLAAGGNDAGMSRDSESMPSHRGNAATSPDMNHGGMMGRGMSDGPMMQGGMMDMMNGMGACGGMMGGPAMSGRMMPQLPPGNEKLQLQMQAEMMQKMGEIMAKYAAQIDDKRGGR